MHSVDALEVEAVPAKKPKGDETSPAPTFLPRAGKIVEQHAVGLGSKKMGFRAWGLGPKNPNGSLTLWISQPASFP